MNNTYLNIIKLLLLLLFSQFEDHRIGKFSNNIDFRKLFKLCVRTTLSQIGQITSLIKKQELLLLETTLGNLYHWKEEIVMAPPGQAGNGLMIYEK